jgi:hypothetical protein
MTASCSTTHQTSREPKPSGFLIDYSMLNNGKFGEAHKIYVKSQTNWKQYNKIMIDPIQVWASKDSDINKAPKRDVKSILSYLHSSIRHAVQQDFEITHAPGPRVLRLKVALTDGQASRPISDLVSNLIPFSLALSYIKRIAGRTHTSVGLASVEAELVDSVSGERLMAAMDSRAGTKVIRGKLDSWDDVKEAFEHWSRKLHSRLKDLSAGK